MIYGMQGKLAGSYATEDWGETTMGGSLEVSDPTFFYDRASWVSLEDQAFTQLVIAKPVEQIEYAKTIESQLREVLGQRDELHQPNSKVDEIERKLELVLEKLRAFEPLTACLTIPIENFISKPYQVVRPFTAVLIPSEGGFEASFYDANLSTYGDTESEAIENLKELLLDTLERLNELNDDDLGPGPKKQKEILTSLIARVPS